jgi:hypothetical protein
MRDLTRVVEDKLMRDIVNDFRTYNPSPSMGPAAKVTPVDAAPVKTGDVGPQHRPIDRSGWVDPPKVDNWRPPGIELMDRMMDHQDALDKAARIEELVKAAGAIAALQPKEKKEGK